MYFRGSVNPGRSSTVGPTAQLGSRSVKRVLLSGVSIFSWMAAGAAAAASTGLVVVAQAPIARTCVGAPLLVPLASQCPISRPNIPLAPQWGRRSGLPRLRKPGPLCGVSWAASELHRSRRGSTLVDDAVSRRGVRGVRGEEAAGTPCSGSGCRVLRISGMARGEWGWRGEAGGEGGRGEMGGEEPSRRAKGWAAEWPAGKAAG